MSEVIQLDRVAQERELEAEYQKWEALLKVSYETPAGPSREQANELAIAAEKRVVVLGVRIRRIG